jgi:hypothetical protein
MYINWRKKEMVMTMALYGPQGSGKTTTWRYIARKALEPPEEGADTTTLYLQDIQGKRLLLNVRDTPGSTEASTRRRVSLYGVDGLIFVADSLPERREANDQSLYELEEHLGAMNKTIYGLPFIFQYNKRDLETVEPISKLQKRLNPDRIFLHQPTSAKTGEGIVETLQCITDLILTTVL